MNIERILQLADVIEAQPHTDQQADSGFNMNFFAHTCGTPSCIAGWAVHLARPGTYPENEELAQEWLELNNQQARQLFWGEGTKRAFLPDITPAHAAFALRHFAETGTVDWRLAMSK